MCGIVGAATRPGASRLDVDAAIRKLYHRGPDDQGYWCDESAQLGFARLSIIDLTPAGHQPMASPDGRYTIVFNGEIYNFPALRKDLEDLGESFRRHSDTEVLLRLFVRRHHPAQTPEIISLPIAAGDPSYLKWLLSEC